MLTAERWERAKLLFDAALEKDIAERHAFLVAECAGDAALLREVESLLAAHDESEGLMDRGALHVMGLAADGNPLPGERIGAYRLIREIGSGGMGTVFEGERADAGFHQRVAVKLVKKGMDSEAILRRFTRERQILAGLEHPNIARLIDGGVTDAGQSYLVMEFVDGEPVHDYLERTGASLRERLKIFRDVCLAVHFAHQNLVVHRDLKPSNILVTRDGVVKLLDFGVAKVLRPDGDAAATLTEPEARFLTPSYASPEQIRGDPVTTASDVYALGVVLYEILAGSAPFEFGSASLGEIARTITHEDPPRPSDMVRAAGARGALPAAREIAGELDNIVLMTMRKEPERRYASAAALADDVRRYLDGRPVSAQKDSAVYRVRKFASRHRAAVAAAVAAFVFLIAGAGATLWQARNADAARASAEQHLRDVQSLTRTLIFDVHDAIANLPGATSARELVLSRASAHLESMVSAGGGDRALLRDVAEGYLRLAILQGFPQGGNLGDMQAARVSLSRGREVAAGLVAQDSGDLRARRTLAVLNEKFGDIDAWTGNVKSGVEHARAALAGFTSLAEAQPDSTRAQLSLVISYVKLGDLLGNPLFPNAGDREGAMQSYDTALASLQRPPLAASNDRGVRRYLALVHERRASLLRSEPDLAAAAAEYTRSLEMRQALRDSAPGADVIRDVAVTHQSLCEVRREMRMLSDARAHCGSARALFEELHAADETSIQPTEDMARLGASLSRLAAAEKRYGAAADELRRAVQLREGVFAAHPENIVNARELVALLTDLSALIAEHGAGTAALRAGNAGGEERRRAMTVVQHMQKAGADVARELARIDSLARATGAPRGD